MAQATHTHWWVWIGLSLWLVAGCSHPLSPAVYREADTTLSVKRLREAPDSYKDRTVLLGGELLSTRNLHDGTLLEVLQKPLDRTTRPQETDQTEGRFLAMCDTYLDPAIYKAGRHVTIAGRVLGTRTDKVGEADYLYPLISCVETYLWPATATGTYTTFGYYPSWWWGAPYWYTPFRGRYGWGYGRWRWR